MARPPIAAPRTIRALFHYTWRELNKLYNTPSGIPEAPIDGNQYARQDGDWEEVDSFPEAPIDGTPYARQDADWEPITFPSTIPQMEFVAKQEIQTITLTGSGSSFDFTSIPAGYDRWTIEGLCYTDLSPAVSSTLFIAINGDTTAANYHRQIHAARDGAPDDTEGSDNAIASLTTRGTGVPVTAKTSIHLTIEDPDGSQLKNVISNSLRPSSATHLGKYDIYLTHKTLTAAITSISLYAASGNMHGTLTLYGEKSVSTVTTEGYETIEEDGTPVTQRKILDFDGDHFAVTDDTVDTTQVTLSSADVASLALADSALQNVVEDTTPELGGALDALRNDITNVRHMSITGQAAAYTSYPGAYINLPDSHAYNYHYLGLGLGVVIPPAMNFEGNHTIGVSGFILGIGSLFNVLPVIKNNPAGAYNITPFYVVNVGLKYQADAQTITSSGIDIYSAPKLEGINAGTMNCSRYVVLYSAMEVLAGATLAARHAVIFADATGAGSVAGQAAFVVAPLTKATNNTNWLSGTTAVPSGNWNTYQSDTRPNRWGGGHQYASRTSSSTTVTITTADDTVYLSSTSTVTATLPSAATCAGFRVTIKKTGASGTVNIKSVSSQTADGVDITSGSIAISTQWHLVTLQSDGAGWMVLKNGAP